MPKIQKSRADLLEAHFLLNKFCAFPFLLCRHFVDVIYYYAFNETEAFQERKNYVSFLGRLRVFSTVRLLGSILSKFWAEINPEKTARFTEHFTSIIHTFSVRLLCFCSQLPKISQQNPECTLKKLYVQYK